MNTSFWLGTAIGFLVCASFVTATLWELNRGGLAVAIDTRGLAASVQAEVRQYVLLELPGTLARLRQELPGFVAGQVADRFPGDKLHLGPLEIEVPTSVAREWQLRLTQELTRAAGDMLDDVNSGQMAERVGQEAGRLVEQHLEAILTNWQPELRPLPWLTVPVRVLPN